MPQEQNMAGKRRRRKRTQQPVKRGAAPQKQLSLGEALARTMIPAATQSLLGLGIGQISDYVASERRAEAAALADTQRQAAAALLAQRQKTARQEDWERGESTKVGTQQHADRRRREALEERENARIMANIEGLRGQYAMEGEAAGPARHEEGRVYGGPEGLTAEEAKEMRAAAPDVAIAQFGGDAPLSRFVDPEKTEERREPGRQSDRQLAAARYARAKEGVPGAEEEISRAARTGELVGRGKEATAEVTTAIAEQQAGAGVRAGHLEEMVKDYNRFQGAYMGAGGKPPRLDKVKSTNVRLKQLLATYAAPGPDGKDATKTNEYERLQGLLTMGEDLAADMARRNKAGSKSGTWVRLADGTAVPYRKYRAEKKRIADRRMTGKDVGDAAWNEYVVNYTYATETDNSGKRFRSEEAATSHGSGIVKRTTRPTAAAAKSELTAAAADVNLQAQGTIDLLDAFETADQRVVDLQARVSKLAGELYGKIQERQRSPGTYASGRLAIDIKQKQDELKWLIGKVPKANQSGQPGGKDATTEEVLATSELGKAMKAREDAERAAIDPATGVRYIRPTLVTGAQIGAQRRRETAAQEAAAQEQERARREAESKRVWQGIAADPRAYASSLAEGRMSPEDVGKRLRRLDHVMQNFMKKTGRALTGDEMVEFQRARDTLRSRSPEATAGEVSTERYGEAIEEKEKEKEKPAPRKKSTQKQSRVRKKSRREDVETEDAEDAEDIEPAFTVETPATTLSRPRVRRFKADENMAPDEIVSYKGETMTAREARERIRQEKRVK